MDGSIRRNFTYLGLPPRHSNRNQGTSLGNVGLAHGIHSSTNMNPIDGKGVVEVTTEEDINRTFLALGNQKVVQNPWVRKSINMNQGGNNGIGPVVIMGNGNRIVPSLGNINIGQIHGVCSCGDMTQGGRNGIGHVTIMGDERSNFLSSAEENINQDSVVHNSVNMNQGGDNGVGEVIKEENVSSKFPSLGNKNYGQVPMGHNFKNLKEGNENGNVASKRMLNYGSSFASSSKTTTNFEPNFDPTGRWDQKEVDKTPTPEHLQCCKHAKKARTSKAERLEELEKDYDDLKNLVPKRRRQIFVEQQNVQSLTGVNRALKERILAHNREQILKEATILVLQREKEELWHKVYQQQQQLQQHQL